MPATPAERMLPPCKFLLTSTTTHGSAPPPSPTPQKNAYLWMNTQDTGAVEVWGTPEFPTHGLWDVHGKFLTHAIYADGVTMDISGDFPNGIKFYGSEGWIFVTRDEMVTPTDPGGKAAVAPKPLVASDPKILDSVIGPNEAHLYQSNDQHGN